MTSSEYFWCFNILNMLRSLYLQSPVKLLCKTNCRCILKKGVSSLLNKHTNSYVITGLRNYTVLFFFMKIVLCLIIQGEILWTSDKTEAPFAPQSMAPITDSKKMVYITLSDYVFNTMFYQAHKHNMLVFNLTSKNVNICFLQTGLSARRKKWTFIFT